MANPHPKDPKEREESEVRELRFRNAVRCNILGSYKSYMRFDCVWICIPSGLLGFEKLGKMTSV